MPKAKRESRNKNRHAVSVHITHEMKQSLTALAEKYDRTTADMIRAVLKIGIPMMEGLSRAEEIMVSEYISLFRRLRKVRTLKEM